MERLLETHGERHSCRLMGSWPPARAPDADSAGRGVLAEQELPHGALALARGGQLDRLQPRERPGGEDSPIFSLGHAARPAAAAAAARLAAAAAAAAAASTAAAAAATPATPAALLLLIRGADVAARPGLVATHKTIRPAVIQPELRRRGRNESRNVSF